MATATKNSTWDINLSTTNPITIATSGKYVDRDIKITPGAATVTPTGQNCIFGTTNTSNVTVDATTTKGFIPDGYDTPAKNLKGIKLGKGYQFDIENDITDTVTVEYRSDTNCLNFVFN